MLENPIRPEVNGRKGVKKGVVVKAGSRMYESRVDGSFLFFHGCVRLQDFLLQDRRVAVHEMRQGS